MGWKSYPILRLLIPMIIGMTGADLIYQTVHMSSHFTLLMVCVSLALLCIIHFHESDQPHKSKSLFMPATLFFAFSFGFMLVTYALDHATQQYGGKWRRQIYHTNILCNNNAQNAQKKLHVIYHEHGLTGESGSIIEAMTIGRKTELTKATKAAFSRAGLSHILALSGFHISIVFFILQALFLGHIVTLRWRIISNALTLLCLWAYTFMAGMQPSLVRAVIMCTLLVLTSTSTHRVMSLNSCAIAAMIILIVNPLMLFHIGFQLSFTAVAGICLIGMPLCNKYANKSLSHVAPHSIILAIAYKVYNAIMSIVIISTICNIFTLPLVAYYFHQIPRLSLISNLLTTILVSSLIVIAAIWWIFIWCTPICTVLTTLLIKIADIICFIAHYIANTTIAIYTWAPTFIDVLFLYAIILSSTFLYHHPTIKKAYTLLFSIILYCIFITFKRISI